MSVVKKQNEETKEKEGGMSIGAEHVNRSLPYDVIGEILSRLPVKSVLRSKAVCKPWCSLIHDPNFTRLHFDRSNREEDDHACLFLENRQDKKLYVFSLNGESEDAPTTFISKHDLPTHTSRSTAYCNGLLCYHNWSINFWVCNLTTKQQIKLPLPPIPNFINFGFGFNPSTNQYTLVLFSHLHGCHLFTLGTTTSWRKIESKPSNPCLLYSAKTLCVNGVLHWYSSSLNSITLFDLKTQKFGDLSYPTNFNHSTSSRLYEYQGTLCLFYTDSDKDVFDLWILKDYSTHSWDYQQFILSHPYPFGRQTIIVRNWDILTISSTWERDYSYCLHSYNLHTCVSKKIGLIGLPSAYMVSLGEYEENIITLTTQ